MEIFNHLSITRIEGSGSQRVYSGMIEIPSTLIRDLGFKLSGWRTSW